MDTIKCLGSGRLAAVGDGHPICPVCHQRKSIGLPDRFPGRKPGTVIVPEHEERAG